MGKPLRVGELSVEVVLKDIRNIHLTVHPPEGRVRVSAPSRMPLDTLRVFLISKLGWIRRQQQQLRSQPRESRRDYVDLESHYVWGGRYLLRVIEQEAPPSVSLSNRRLQLRVRPGTSAARQQALLDAWYRDQVRRAAEPLIRQWELRLGVRVNRLFVQRMKTKWGSCSHRAGNLRFNSELAKKPRECLEYIVVHELLHLIEPTHNARFLEHLQRAMPRWRFVRQQLNELPVRYENWSY